ncbi:MAG TPA: hypothetical protein VHX88_19725 [Solirubrobacteraceae bacterium]|jgi:hypothetical protein|nr:hypothetical protein [Solirubrobacteraceae bacterium]
MRHHLHLSERRPARSVAARRFGIAARPERRPGVGPSSSDPETVRARQAGGPVDRAQYNCECGYAFAAQVSTTVRCPHCGDHQAW